jgi:hypothetical protein
MRLITVNQSGGWVGHGRVAEGGESGGGGGGD